MGSNITKLSRRDGCINTESCRTESVSSKEIDDSNDDCPCAGSLVPVFILVLLPLHLGLVGLVAAAEELVILVDSPSDGTRGETPQRLVLALQNPTTESLVRSQ